MQKNCKTSKNWQRIVLKCSPNKEKKVRLLKKNYIKLRKNVRNTGQLELMKSQLKNLKEKMSLTNEESLQKN